MKPYVALIWIVLAVIMFSYLIFHNIRMTKVLRAVMEITENSRNRCETLLDEMKKCTDKKEKKLILKKFETEEKEIRELFSKEKEWPGQGKRIREHLNMIKGYRIAAKEIAGREN